MMAIGSGLGITVGVIISGGSGIALGAVFGAGLGLSAAMFTWPMQRKPDSQ
jgi:hypothetical protein